MISWNWFIKHERKLSMGLNIVFLAIAFVSLLNGHNLRALTFFVTSVLCIGIDILINKLRKMID